MALNSGSSIILETRPLVFLKGKSTIKSKSSGFQQKHVLLHDPFSAAANEALFKLAKLNNVDGEEDHDGEPTGEVDEIYVPKPKKFLLAKSSHKLDVPSPIHINHGKANGNNKNFGMDEHTRVSFYSRLPVGIRTFNKFPVRKLYN